MIKTKQTSHETIIETAETIDRARNKQRGKVTPSSEKPDDSKIPPLPPISGEGSREEAPFSRASGKFRGGPSLENFPYPFRKELSTHLFLEAQKCIKSERQTNNAKTENNALFFCGTRRLEHFSTHLSLERDRGRLLLLERVGGLRVEGCHSKTSSVIIFEKEAVDPSLLGAQNVLSSVFGSSPSRQEGWIFAIVFSNTLRQIRESVMILSSSSFEECGSRNNNKRELLCNRKE
ncbi:hypothetical protein CEXT_402071 [Caerostris extrusa]|uniref:Uncharacterized protein n=1 Tax=Caerostris extrusa TaxID=172846 RepID=A0AAV4W7Q5_CAEEX|nr:hypothetical protein CEXT_402071 [Caerostris extrusa]